MRSQMNRAENVDRRRGRAAQLLTRVVATGRFDIQRLAAELVVDERAIANFISGAIEIPLDRQLCIARFVIENMPDLARFGRNLLGQIEAAAAFNRSETVVHSSRPVPNSRSF